MSNLAQRVREALSARGISQNHLAKHCNVSRQAMSLYLHPDPTKRINLPDEMVPKIAELLLVEPAWLTGASRTGAPTKKDTLVSEHTVRYRHTAHAIMIREFCEKVTARHPTWMAHFDRHLYVTPEDAMPVDYASNKLVMSVVPPRSDAHAIRSMLLQLFVVKCADEHLGMTRRYIVASMLVTPTLKKEAAYTGVELLEYENAQDLADMVLKAELA